MSMFRQQGWDKCIRSAHWLIAALLLTNMFFVDADDYLDDYLQDTGFYNFISDSFAYNYVADHIADYSLHELLGWSILCLLVLRLIWGLTWAKGPNHLKDFIPSYQKAFHHIQLIKTRTTEQEIGHNAFGSLAIYLMWLLVVTIVLTGWGQDTDWGFEHKVDLWHSWAVAAMKWLIALHIIAVIITSLRLKQNLVKAMITGHFKPKNLV